MQIKERSVWAGSVLGAISASACCLGPIILGAVGVGSLGAAAALAPYRPWLLALTAGLLGAGRADCESEISRELRREPGVRQARVSYDKGRAWVAMDRQVSTAQLTAAVARAGYKARVESH